MHPLLERIAPPEGAELGVYLAEDVDLDLYPWSSNERSVFDVGVAGDEWTGCPWREI